MPELKADIITQLKKELLALQGFRPLVHAQQLIDIGTINHSFPHSQFPLGVNHEFICNKLSSRPWAVRSNLFYGRLYNGDKVLIRPGAECLHVAAV